jgi:glutaminase
MSFRREDVEKIFNKVKQMKQKGKNADYIPDLKKGNPNIYAISVCNIKGEVMNFGDYDYEVGIESVSKVFTLALALNIHGIKKLIHHVGKTKEKHEFNSIKDVVQLKNHTVNSFVNAGAMATTSLLYDETKSNESNEWEINKIILKNMEDFAGRKLKVNDHLYLSEYKTSEHNKKLINKLVSYGRFYGEPETVLKTYTKQCSVMVNSKDISVMAATLANKGINPLTHKSLISREKINYIIEHMSEHGLYNETPMWWEETCFPAKSGVGGIIMIVIPGVMGIGIVSPPLNKYGNSYKGVETGKLLANIPIFYDS